jgi:hypothetical protein
VRRRVRTNERGIEFHFFHHSGSASDLHITVVHGTTADDAISTYFDGVTDYDADHRRFVTMTATHTLFWNWIEQDKAVYVISCIKAGE